MARADVELIAISDLKPWARNARTHSKKQVRQIAESIETFGFTNPVLIDERRTILAGHGRVEAARLLGRDEVPCLRLDDMSEDEKRAYVLADNKLALNAGWDEDLLAAELGALVSADLDFDVSITGFSIPEIDGVLASVAPEEPGDPEDDLLPGEIAPRVRNGDVWQLGPHRLVCGDALEGAVVEELMAGDMARMVFSDPPYNVKIDGHVGNSGKIQHREFAMASGEMTVSEFTGFLERAFQNMADHSVDGSIHYLCMDWRHMSEMLAAGQGVYDELKNLIVWAKDNGGMGTFYRSRHELIFVFKKGKAAHINTFELGQHGRYRTNVWEYRGANSRHAGRMDGQASPDDCRRNPGCLGPRRDRAGSLWRLGVDHDRRREDRPSRVSLRTGSDLLRSHLGPLGSLREGRGCAGGLWLAASDRDAGGGRMTEKKTKLPVRKSDADYEVGYAKPPANTRFKPGQSGNPKGRPKGAKNKRPRLNEERLKGIILDEAYRDITVRDGDRNVTIPMAQAVVRSLAVNAAKGLHRSQRLFAEMLSATERQNKELADEWFSTALDYKIEWERELDRRRRLGITDLPEPVPHPDQVKIDMHTAEARIKGPATKEEKAQLELWLERKTMFEEERDELLEDIKAEDDADVRARMEEDLQQVDRVLEIIEKLVERIGY